jgi:hypothetical protein
MLPARKVSVTLGGGYYHLRAPLLNAVVKVSPPVGCVKYKAQDIVLAGQILLFLITYRIIRRKRPRGNVEILCLGPLIAV